MIIVTHDGYLSKIDDIRADFNLRHHKTALNRHLDRPPSPQDKGDMTANLPGMMAQDSEVDFFFLFPTKNVALLVETNDT